MRELVIYLCITQNLCLIKYAIYISIQVDSLDNEINDVSTIALNLLFRKK